MEKDVNIESKFSVKKQMILQGPIFFFCTPTDLLKGSCHPSTLPHPHFSSKNIIQAFSYHVNLGTLYIYFQLIRYWEAYWTVRTLDLDGAPWTTDYRNLRGHFGTFYFALSPSHRSWDNHGTPRWPSGETDYPTEVDTYWFSLISKCIHNFLERNLFFIHCVLQHNTHTPTATHSLPEVARTRSISLNGIYLTGLLRLTGCRSLPSTDLLLKYLFSSKYCQ